ncbi:Rv1733c family protein [Streptomyces spectabilis]|uniref:Uncharacterized protein n=1 Tax=Streptomyces spectabilis TaxID=68270 RepID=A0A5P2XHB3_STRST|nr:hypothetical protein [Streptomyces spectabilis]MBB5102064.1 hypothetical protein [Streptomyces spectabilis]MCI3907114.1 hypothetical protein [Streptomyces spectabilis]QEV63878.1 hypothetical protein CP982_38565 [Streptomyces spectabilis]GGV36015.1 hypothetical protein GCM10010245_57710 [Streptomyces spectabilis]
MRSRVLWWRWRRGPLRRRSDVVEAWTVLVVGVVLFLGVPAAGAAAGFAVHADAERAARAAAATRHRVTATLTADAPPPVPAVGAVPLYDVPARWTEPDGAERTGNARVIAGSRRGEHAAVWLDERGRVAGAPPGAEDVALRTASAALAAAAATALAALLARHAVGRVLDRQRLAAWEREWRRTGPEWSGWTA